MRCLCDSNFPPKSPGWSRPLAPQIRLSSRIVSTQNTPPYVHCLI